MATIKSFEEIEAWKGARELTRKIYALSNKGNFSKDLGLKSQIRRSAVSVMSNIAEGFESETQGTFIRYLNVAKGSAGELRSQLYVARDQAYITNTCFYSLCDQSKKISSQIAKLAQYLKSR
jgi:four helix bundle protein